MGKIKFEDLSVPMQIGMGYAIFSVACFIAWICILIGIGIAVLMTAYY